MSSELLLINPSGRRRKTRKTAKSRSRRAAPAASPRRAAKRRRNPIAAVRRRVMRSANPARRRHHRRRNPISLGRASTYVTALTDALIGAGGSVAIDALMGQLNPMLPLSMRRVPGTVSVGDAVKAVITIALGALLSKPTKGYSRKAAVGALTVQAAEVIKTFVPVTMAMGYANPARITNMNARVGPNRGALSAFTSGTALLNAYERPGGMTPLLNSAASRESRVR